MPAPAVDRAGNPRLRCCAGANDGRWDCGLRRDRTASCGQPSTRDHRNHRNDWQGEEKRDSDHPFTAPLSTPLKKKRCINAKMMITGINATIVPAAIWRGSAPSAEFR